MQDLFDFFDCSQNVEDCDVLHECLFALVQEGVVKDVVDEEVDELRG